MDEKLSRFFVFFLRIGFTTATEESIEKKIKSSGVRVTRFWLLNLKKGKANFAVLS